MMTIAIWQFALLCVLALPAIALGAIVLGTWAWKRLAFSLWNARASLAHSAMLRREHRRGNWQQFMHD